MTSLSREVRRLAQSWTTNPGSWPKFLEWTEIQNIRGWAGQRIDFQFPIVAIAGENGVGKSSILQALASLYRAPAGEKSNFATDFFPDTPWENVTDAQIRFSLREGTANTAGSIRKPTSRWLGNPSRRQRAVRYLDLRRTQPIAAQRGYPKLIKSSVRETTSDAFDLEKLTRYSSILGRTYTQARHSVTNADARLRVPVVGQGAASYSGFHQGAGETAVADLLAVSAPNTALLLIDEIETSLHTRAQRRLIRDLAELARLKHLQIVVTTHSPYVLRELPPSARIYVMQTAAGKQVVRGISPEFALTQMDDENHPELDIYVEDDEAKIFMEELLYRYADQLARRVHILPYGSAQVGKSLGTMVIQQRFPRPTVVFLDGDQDEAQGCERLPGDPDPPERFVFEDLRQRGWAGVAQRIERSHASLVDALEAAMALPDHHDWVEHAANRVVIGGHQLWRALVATWLVDCATDAQRNALVNPIRDAMPT